MPPKTSFRTILHILRVLWPIKKDRPSARSAPASRFGETSPQEDQTMNGKIVLGLTLGMLGLACAGCASDPGIVRAQAPGPDGAMAAAPAPNGVVYGTPQNPCPECGSTDGTCLHCCLGGCLANYQPHHRYWSHYCPPDAGTCRLGSNGYCLPSVACDHGPLVYPPNPTPGAIVQYPYYTCKGPDDFFWPPINQSGTR
jgi:hypothetical protein